MQEEIEFSLPEGWQSVILDGNSNIRSTQLRTHLKRIAKTRKISNSHPVLFVIFFQKGSRSNYKPSNDTLSLPAPSNDTPSLPATSNDKRSSPANNEVLFAISPIDRPPLTTMQNRNLIQNGVENVDYLRDFSLDIEDFAEKYNHVMTSFDSVKEGGAESRD
ncbi:unnamed protein product, partial [Rotaria magnacalcarata]